MSYKNYRELEFSDQRQYLCVKEEEKETRQIQEYCQNFAVMYEALEETLEEKIS